MRSPLHPEATLVEKQIEPGLLAYECPVSGGIWIPLQSYVNWQAGVPKQSRPEPSNAPAVFSDDTGRRALLCPESGRILIRYRVGKDLHFQIDRSPMTGGVWLDKGEWEALKSRGLHDHMHLIFTSSYQARVRSAEHEEHLQQMFRERIGPEAFAKAGEIRNWIRSHPRKRDIICFLLDGDEGSHTRE